MACILCVDDEPNILTGLKAALSVKGHEVIPAASPEEALAAVMEHRPDLILLDVMMPTGSEGFHVVWRLRQLDDEELANIPVIMATAVHEHTELRFYPEQTDGTYEPGEFLPVQGWLDKPYTNEALYATVDRVLAGESDVRPQ
jgi:CheY-like chemotaxis protein